MRLRVPAEYYQQFNADYALEVPAEGYGGWQSTTLDLDLAHTAVVVMHAWECGTPETMPGDWRACEYLSRALPICQHVLPRLLAAVRDSGMTLFHVVGDGTYFYDEPGYRRAAALAGPQPHVTQLPSDPGLEALRRFHTERVWPGAPNLADRARTQPLTDFTPEARPLPHEGVAETSEQLFALCQAAEINHLLYAGFSLGACLLLSPGGMLDMQRRGAMCSVLREATTALENHATARQELSKQIELWRVALLFGFVFGVDDLITALRTASDARA